MLKSETFPGKEISCVTCNERYIAIGFMDGTLCMYDKIQRSMQSWKGHEFRVTGLVLLWADGLVSVGGDGYFKKWKDQRLENQDNENHDGMGLVWSNYLCPTGIHALTQLSNGQFAVALFHNTVMISSETGDLLSAFMGHHGPVTDVIPLREGYFASGSYDWSIRVEVPDRVVDVGSTPISLAVSSCGKMVAAGCLDGYVRLFHLPEWNIKWSVRTVTRSLSFSPCGRWIVGANSIAIQILSSTTGEDVLTIGTGRLERSMLYGHTVCFSPDGFHMYGDGRKDALCIWNLCKKDDCIASMLYRQTSVVSKQLFHNIRTKFKINFLYSQNE